MRDERRKEERSKQGQTNKASTCIYTYVLHKLNVREHEEVVEDVVDASVSGSSLSDQRVHLSLNLMSSAHHPLTELLQVEQHLHVHVHVVVLRTTCTYICTW